MLVPQHQSAYRNLRSFFNDIARLYEEFTPPTSKVRPPKLPHLPPKALTLEQIQRLLMTGNSIAHKGGYRGRLARRDGFLIRFL